MSEKNKVQPSTLYLVATPIGNLADLSERAIKVLSEVSFIAAEDTRNTRALLSHFDIHAELVSYHEHNKVERGPQLIARLLSGESCALVTDAGMPAISDPGEDLVRLAAEAGVTVTCIPGGTAAVTALALSALPTGRFVFEGFLPTDKREKKDRLDALLREERTAILYEAPHRLKKTLSELCDALGGERPISLCRELTKLNEEITRTTLAGAVKLYTEREPRGEYVLVLGGATPVEVAVNWEDITPAEHVKAFEDSGLSRMDAIKAAAKERGLSKSIFYKMLQDGE